MPVLKVRYPIGFSIGRLHTVCSELVPAVFHSEQGPLRPGDILFAADLSGPADAYGATILIEVEAHDFPDRRHNIDDRTTTLHAAIKHFFPGITFTVWAKLVTAGYSSDGGNNFPFDGDMSLTAALERLQMQLS